MGPGQHPAVCSLGLRGAAMATKRAKKPLAPEAAAPPEFDMSDPSSSSMAGRPLSSRHARSRSRITKRAVRVLHLADRTMAGLPEGGGYSSPAAANCSCVRWRRSTTPICPSNPACGRHGDPGDVQDRRDQGRPRHGVIRAAARAERARIHDVNGKGPKRSPRESRSGDRQRQTLVA